MRIFSVKMFFLILSLLGQLLFAQDIEDLVSNYRGENGKGYIQPLGDVFGATLNSGINQSVKIPRLGLHLKLGIHAMAAFVSDAQRVYSATTEDPFLPQQTAEVPTILGDEEETSVSGIGGTAFLFPGGLDVKRLPLAVPQASFGSIFGTEVMIRYIKLKLDDNFKELKLTGYGFRHSISQYFMLFPVDLAATFFKQNFKLGDIVDASATYYGLQASKSVGLIGIYGGVGLGKSSLDIEYEYDSLIESETIRFEIQSKTKFRTNVGLEINLLLFRLYADYNMGPQNIVSLGANIGL
jgi:hypothetical protein